MKNALLTLLPGVEARRTDPVAPSPLGLSAATETEMATASPRTSRRAPTLSVIVINYNGGLWLERCVQSLRRQSLADELEIIVADNASPDHSDELANKLLSDWSNAIVLQHVRNLGYSGGNNRAAALARGRYLLFLNNDTWLEPDCLERLLEEAQAAGATVACPMVMDYLDQNAQIAGGGGFDIFGLVCGSARRLSRQEMFVANGCALLVEADSFRKLGGFDNEFFMYADEYDLCWRVWLTGGKVIWAPSARLHHRGAAAVNPLGQQQVLENRTSDTKRFYANRNNLLVLLKNAQHLLLLTLPLQLLLLTIEAVVMGVLTRRWSHIRRAYAGVFRDCWRLRRHILSERHRLRSLRKHGDFWMLRFLRPCFNRWEELRRLRRFGLPRVDPN